MIKKTIDFLLFPLRWYQLRRRRQQRLEELKKRDPFIYK